MTAEHPLPLRSSLDPGLDVELPAWLRKKLEELVRGQDRTLAVPAQPRIRDRGGPVGPPSS